MEYIGYFILAILGLVLIVKIFAWPLAVLTKLIINGIVGAVLLVLVNAVGGLLAQIGINACSFNCRIFLECRVIFLIIFDLFL